MTGDLLELLSQPDVPPVPETLELQVHRRVNHWLLIYHGIDLVFRGLPYAAFHLARAVLGLARYSLTGRFGDPWRLRPEGRDFFS